MGVSANDETLTSFQPQSDASPRAGRVNSLDIVRGIIMILMAVDHVRVYAGVPAGGPTPGVFFTRWITHFSAPGFAFLAGTGAFLYGRRLANTGALSRFLLVRGIMLVVLELTVIRLAWTFNTDFAHYNLAGVIWMLGWCMILMAALVHLPTAAIGVIGALIVLGQAVFNPIARALPGAIGSFLYLGGMTEIAGLPIGVLYVIVPWIGVMAMGYWFGTVITLEPEARRRRCFWMGLGATAAFLLIATGLAGHDPITRLDTADGDALRTALIEVSEQLAQAIVRDGEGATKFIAVQIDGGKTEHECKQVAYAIAHSPLVKTAFFASVSVVMIACAASYQCAA